MKNKEVLEAIKKSVLENTTLNKIGNVRKNWIRIKVGKIAYNTAHYEVIIRDEIISIELHFEDAKTKEKFQHAIAIDSERYEWFAWADGRKNCNAKSIRLKKTYKMKDFNDEMLKNITEDFKNISIDFTEKITKFVENEKNNYLVFEKITIEDIKNAGVEIDEKGLNPKFKARFYEVEINNKFYPTKEIVRIAFRNRMGKNIPESYNFTSYDSQRILRKLKFNVVKITDDDKNSKRILIENYKNHLIKNGNSEEIYKWELVKKFQKTTSHNDFFDDIFKNIKKLDFSNLITWRKNIYKNPERFFKNKDVLIENITLLFNEQKNLKERIELFLEHVNTFLNQKDISQDYRTISLFLAFQFPQKYFIYKPNLYNKFVKKFNIAPKKTNEKYFHYQELLSEFTEKYIKSDNELLKLVKKELNENCYADENHTILAQDILYYNFEKMENEEDKIIEDIENKTNTMKKLPLNKILYGPPGTGKTYNTINKTIEILDNNFYVENQKLTNEKEIRNNLKNRFEELKNSGQIEFVTFHQSYGYEDFVEGLKAETDEGNISYRVKSGIFKKLCERAKKTDEEVLIENNFEEALDELKIEASEDRIEWQTIKDKKFTFFYTGTTTFRIIPNSSDKKFKNDEGWNVSLENIKKVYKNKNAKIYNSSYTKAILNYLFEKKELQRYKEVEKKSKKKPYIIIIDEINRGNISNIFGELITLIEESKRMGNDEELQLTLPNSSDEKFSVPNNLYILGTMNTADKSILHMDTALRRRFEFEECMPQPELLSELKFSEIDVEKILETINKRITYLYDRDHCIGHSYFMSLMYLPDNKKLEKLQEIFAKNIIPLLQEYFYDDWEKINMVLGNNGFITNISSDFNKKNLFPNLTKEIDEYFDEEKNFFTVTLHKKWEEEDFINIYKNISDINNDET